METRLLAIMLTDISGYTAFSSTADRAGVVAGLSLLTFTGAAQAICLKPRITSVSFSPAEPVEGQPEHRSRAEPLRAQTRVNVIHDGHLARPVVVRAAQAAPDEQMLVLR